MGRKRECKQCQDDFEFAEFSSYLMKLRSKTVFCNSCQTENYFIRPKSGKYALFFIISVIIGLVTFLAGLFIWAVATYNPIDDTFRVSSLITILSGIVGLFVCRLMLNIFIWKSAEITLDRSFKSASDYE